MKKIILYSLLLGFSVNGFGYDENGSFSAVNTKSCGEWVSERNMQKAGDPSVLMVVMGSWITGYITAYNAHVNGTYNILGNTHIESIFLWMDNWCQENPLENLAYGMDDLTIELYPNRTIKAPE